MYDFTIFFWRIFLVVNLIFFKKNHKTMRKKIGRLLQKIFYPNVHPLPSLSKFFIAFNFAGIPGRKMANLMTGKYTTIVFPNNLEEELWSSLHLVMKISVRYWHILIVRFAWCHTHHHQNSRLNVNFDTMSKF